MADGKGADPQLAKLSIEILKQLGITQRVAESFADSSEEERSVKQVNLYGEVFSKMYNVLAELGSVYLNTNDAIRALLEAKETLRLAQDDNGEQGGASLTSGERKRTR